MYSSVPPLDLMLILNTIFTTAAVADLTATAPIAASDFN